MDELMTFEDAQQQEELQELKNDAIKKLKENIELTPKNNPEFFDIPAFIREEAEKEMKANPFKD